MLNHQLDRLFHALADPTRRAVVERLCQGPATVSELKEPFAMSLPAVVQHLKVLEEAGLVTTSKQGRTRTCQIAPQALRTAEGWLTAQRTGWEHKLDRLGTFLEET